MLVERKVSVHDIVVIKMISGEEITGKIVDTDEKSVTISRPVMLTLHQVSGHGAVAFMPFLLGLEDNGKIRVGLDKMLVEPFKARSDLAAQYTKATTGLDVPNTKLVV